MARPGRSKQVVVEARTTGRDGPEEHLRCEWCGWTWVRDVNFGAERKCPTRAMHGRLDVLADRERARYEGRPVPEER